MYCNSFISTLQALLIQTFVKGVGYLTPDFFTNFSSSTPSQAGIKGALAGTIWLMISIIQSLSFLCRYSDLFRRIR